MENFAGEKHKAKRTSIRQFNSVAITPDYALLNSDKLKVSEAGFTSKCKSRGL
jgi:hypothetical protein